MRNIAIIQTSLHRKRFVQPAIARAVNLLHFDLHRNAVFHRLHVADHPDNLTAGVKGIQGVQRRVQRFAVEGAEAFIKKQESIRVLWLTGSDSARASAGADEETFAAGEGAGVAHGVGLPYRQPPAPAPRWPCAVADSAMQAVELLVCQPDQIIQRQPRANLRNRSPVLEPISELR